MVDLKWEILFFLFQEVLEVFVWITGGKKWHGETLWNYLSLCIISEDNWHVKGKGWVPRSTLLAWNCDNADSPVQSLLLCLQQTMPPSLCSGSWCPCPDKKTRSASRCSSRKLQEIPRLPFRFQSRCLLTVAGNELMGGTGEEWGNGRLIIVTQTPCQEWLSTNRAVKMITET